MNAREAILEILERFDDRVDSFDGAVDRVLGRNQVDHRDRRFIFEVVHGVLRHRIRIDYIVEQFLSDRKLVRNGEFMRVLELGVYQILHMDRVPHHAAVNESVNIAKASEKIRKLSGIVNAVLRAVIAARGVVKMPDPQKELSARLSIEFSHPAWLVRRWLDRYGMARTKKMLAFNNEIPAVFLRRRYRGLARQQFETESRDLCDKTPGFGNLYYKLMRKGMAPEDIRLFQLGACTVQSPSAGWVVAMLEPKLGDRCIDVCSAPGGKAAMLAELVGEEGSVCACDVSRQRLWRVVQVRDRMEIGNLHPVLCDGRKLPFAGTFDKALLDVPCSGTGVLHRHPDARTTRREEDISQVLPLQAQLLEAGAQTVVKGGVIVYSTCSMESEENEEQVKAFLGRHTDFKLERPPADIPRQYVDLDGYLRITPFEHELDGMFAARLKKI